MLLPDLSAPAEGVLHQQPNTQLFVNQRVVGSGTMYIAQSRLFWSKDGETRGISLDYPHICIHAVSRDTSAFPHPCLYLMLDYKLEDAIDMNSFSPIATIQGVGLGADNGHDINDDEDEENDSQTAMTELHFVPTGQQEINVLETMYKALNQCQLLHPDPEDEVEEDEEDIEEEEGEYEIDEDGQYEQYEDNMEGELENIQRGVSGLSTQNPNGEDTEEGMETTGQFDDAL